MGVPKSWCAYKHENKTNGKVYIGITSMRPSRRWDCGRGYRANKYFYNSICKHGWDGFTHEVLAENLTREQACICEQALILAYNSNQKEKGYNMANGGEGAGSVSEKTREKQSERMKGNTYMRGFKFSDESRKRLSESKKGKPLTEEHRKKLSENCNRMPEIIAKRTAHAKGNRYKLGCRESEETRRKKSERMKKCQLGSSNPMARSVICLNTQDVFGSVVEAGAYCGLASVNRISDVCKNKRRSAGKKDGKPLTWVFYEDYMKEGGGYRTTKGSYQN